MKPKIRVLGFVKCSILCFFAISLLVEAINGDESKAESNIDTMTSKPHIIFILADDLGFNDVGFHGSAQIPTPNIDALAYSGLILQKYYVNPVCTPSRSALMTGKYPIHTGMQHRVLYAAEPRGLPIDEKIMPQYFNELGYSSHIAGKWHLGHYKKVYTPLYRGFLSHVGFWTGHQDYFDHTAVENHDWGLDIRRGMNVAYDLHGKYSTDLITEEASRVIIGHNVTKGPLFLYVSHAAVHSGNPYNPLPAPDENVAKMEHITHIGRRKYAAMVTKLDESVGLIVRQLSQKNMLENSIIVFSTDNGGPAQGFNLNHASNWPLRGVKNTLWEGGVRGAGLLWYPKLKNAHRVSEQTMHIVDWLPTLLEAIGGEKALSLVEGRKLDGLSIWKALTNDLKSPRNEILHNIDDIYGSAALTVNDWKIVIGSNYKGLWDGWYGPGGERDPKRYDSGAVKKSFAGNSIAGLGNMPTDAEIYRLRQEATVECGDFSNSGGQIKCQPLGAVCLFNIKQDPCEQQNLAERYPEILSHLLSELSLLNRTAVPPSNKPSDPNADPVLWEHTWTNFGDYETAKRNEAIAGDLKKFLK